MIGAEQTPGTTVDPAASGTETPAGAAQPTSAADPSTAPQPLTSLSSLLGGDFEGGQACDADGNCD